MRRQHTIVQELTAGMAGEEHIYPKTYTFDQMRVRVLGNDTQEIRIEGLRSREVLQWTPVPGEVVNVPRDQYRIIFVTKLGLIGSWSVIIDVGDGVHLQPTRQEAMMHPYPGLHMPGGAGRIELLWVPQQSGVARIATDYSTGSNFKINIYRYDDNAATVRQRIAVELNPYDKDFEQAGGTPITRDLAPVAYVYAGYSYIVRLDNLIGTGYTLQVDLGVDLR